MNVSSLFPSAASSAYKYDCSLGYVAVDSFKNAKGYWLKFNRDTTLTVIGRPITPKTIPVSSCWNLIGPFDENVPVSSIVSTPAGIITSAYFSFGSTYSIADTLKPGRGYWVRASSSGTLSKGTPDNLSSLNKKDELEKWIRIEIADGEGNSTSLYLADANEITQNYDLPPVPPHGIFDARFSGDNLVEAIGKMHNVKVSAGSKPIRVTVHNLNGMKLRLRDAVNGSILNTLVIEGKEIALSAGIEDFEILEENLVPDRYSLGQNFPNPFNPTTAIDYQVMKDGNVKISVFNMLGKEIAVIQNGFKKAGSYLIHFNASDLSSGVYFYKMESGAFTEMKKMILIK